MIRVLLACALGWVLIACGGGLADVFDLTVMLPSTSAIVLTYAAFALALSMPLGLSVAVALGYLEDLHQGAPIGTLTLAYTLSYLVLSWGSNRLHVSGWPSRMLTCAGCVALIDILTWLVLYGLAQPLGMRRDALLVVASDLQWHVLATAFAAPAVWIAIDTVFVRLKLRATAVRDSAMPPVRSGQPARASFR